MSRGRRLLVMLFLLSLPLVTPRIRGADEIQYYASLRSLFFDHDLDYENEYRHFYERDPQGLGAFKATFLERLEPGSGRPINFAPLGASLLWAPFFALAHAAALFARVCGLAVPADGYSYPYLAAVAYGSALYAFLGLWLVHGLLRGEAGADDATATTAVVGLWFGTPVLYYMTIAPGFGHAPSLFAVSLLLWLTFDARRGAAAEGVGRDFACGLAAGLAGIVREQDLLFAAFPVGLIGVAWWSKRRNGRAPKRLLAFGAGVFVALLPQLLAYRVLTGRFGPSALVTRKISWSSPHALQVLFDPGHGLFLWTPLLFVAACGLLVFAWRRRDAIAGLLVALALLQVWVNGALQSWHMAGAFGARRFVALTPVFAFGLWAFLEELRRRAKAALGLAVVVLGVWWNVSLMLQFGLKLMDRQRLEWPRVAVNQVTLVPRSAWRAGLLFLTDRERLAKEGL